ncbi:MAG: hypothetical protein ABSC55_04160 [Syntrophorhabdales bacterium]|jgi:hypothetical protein
MELVKRVVIPRRHATYSSFPTFVEHEGRLFVFYRQGEKSVGKCHGLNGKVRCLDLETEVFLRAFQNESEVDLARSGEEQVIFAEGNEFDAIVSKLGDNLFSLATRSYDQHNVMHTFLSVSASPRFEQRREIAVPDVRRLVFYGKAHPCDTGFVFPAYGCVDAERIERPLLIHTDDFHGFELLAALPTNIDGAMLNESSLVRTEDGFAIFMRDDTFPFGIWYAISPDLRRWDTPRRLCFTAHAPMALSTGAELFVAYRDLRGEETAISLLSVSTGVVDMIDVYPGSPYDGGYTDLGIIGEHLYIFYYLGNEEGEPYVCCCRCEFPAEKSPDQSPKDLTVGPHQRNLFRHRTIS